MLAFDRYPVSCTQNNALFMRLDSFLERCHDILDLTQTIVQFSKLAKIEVGGTKGNTLTASVKQVFTSVKNNTFVLHGYKSVSSVGNDLQHEQHCPSLAYLFRLRFTWTSRSLWKSSRVYRMTSWTLQQSRYVVCTTVGQCIAFCKVLDDASVVHVINVCLFA